MKNYMNLIPKWTELCTDCESFMAAHLEKIALQDTIYWLSNKPAPRRLNKFTASIPAMYRCGTVLGMHDP